MIELLPCPFCGSEIKHIESWARSFNPPRLWHEWHHADENPECYIRRSRGLIVCSATDDPETQERSARLWNTRAQPSRQSIKLLTALLLAISLSGCGESVSERSANEARDYGVDKHEHRLRSLEDRVTELEKATP